MHASGSIVPAATYRAAGTSLEVKYFYKNYIINVMIQFNTYLQYSTVYKYYTVLVHLIVYHVHSTLHYHWVTIKYCTHSVGGEQYRRN